MIRAYIQFRIERIRLLGILVTVFTLISAEGAYYFQDFLDPALIKGRRVLEARRLLNSAQLINWKKLKKWLVVWLKVICQTIRCQESVNILHSANTDGTTIYSAIEYTR